MKKKLLTVGAFLFATSLQANAQVPISTNQSLIFTWGPWVILLGYIIVTLTMVPKKVSVKQFFWGNSNTGADPNLFLLVTSAGISWIFGKSIANAAHLADTFGITGGIGYALYYLSFITAGVTIYYIRKKNGFISVSQFIVSKYGTIALRIFQYTIAFRLFNEVWSNTKVAAIYFGTEGSSHYWISVFILTAFTVYYSWKGGLRSSLLTDALQMIYIAVLLGVVLILLGPGLATHGMPVVEGPVAQGGITFCMLALVQVFSYPFHDPVLTDRAFITSPKIMLKGFIMAGIFSGTFIFLYSFVGLYAKRFGIAGDPILTVPALFGLPALMLFNAIMLTSAGSTMDSTFTSMSKLAGRDWSVRTAEPDARQVRKGRIAIIVIAILGNLPLFTIYLGDKAGPAIIAATTISGTMVMGLAPIFILSFLRGAGKLSFYLAFWPGIILGVVAAVHSFFNADFIPKSVALGTGKYSLDLGLNVYGLIICTLGFLIGVFINRSRTPQLA